MATEVEPPKRTYEFRSKPTQAKPSHSLFGSNMQIYSKKEKEEIDSIDIESASVNDDKPPFRVRNMPAALSVKIPDVDILKFQRQQLDYQKRIAKQSKKDLKSLEKQAHFYPGEVISDVALHEPGTEIDAKPHQWYKPSDLNHNNDINILGVRPNKTSFNRDRYQQKPPTHQYSLAGNVLRPGMDFSRKKEIFNEDDLFDPEMYRSRYTKEFNRLPYDDEKNKKEEKKLAIELPPNIKHMFGTKTCQNVLSDSYAVEISSKELEARKPTRRRVRGDSALPEITRKTEVSYDRLGNNLRYDVCPGYTIGPQNSLAKDSWKDDVFLNRDKDPDQHRMKRDHLSTWAESNIIRDRMKKAYDVYRAEALLAKKN